MFLSVIVLFSSCSKDVPTIADPNYAPPVSAVPSHFEQKIIIEQFTSASCGDCPKANLNLDSLVRFNPNRVFGLSFHVNDVMTDTAILTANGKIYHDSLFNPTGIYPSGMINRHLNSFSDISPDQWASHVQTELGHVPSCGLALEAKTIEGNTLKLTVHVGFSETMVGQYNLHAYVVENQVISNDSIYDQMNNFSINGTTPDSLLSLYSLDDTIHRYAHKYVFRKIITPDGVAGDPIPESMMRRGNDYTVIYDLDLTGINTANSGIIVFVDKFAPILTGHWIENVQSVSFGEIKDWN